MKLVNLDWLEVFCLEPLDGFPRSGEYFANRGWHVEVRDYGTPQYREVFTLFDHEHFSLYEVRRDPYSIKSKGGIFDPRACHIRLSNRACYQENPVGGLRDFLIANGYEFRNVSRVDICADFNHFDDKSDPSRFLSKFMEGRFMKINQSKLAAHGVEYLYEKGVRRSSNLSAYASDSIGGREFNSIKWGAPTSAISTKMYNKTLELSQGKPKKYIQHRWKQAGLENSNECPVWRVEFSLNSEIKNFVRLDTGELIYMGLNRIDTPDKIQSLFLILAQVYFHFKRKAKTRNGTPQRKDRCPDYFPFSRFDHTEKVVRLPLTQDPTRTDRILMRRLKEYYEDKISDMTSTEKRGIIDFMTFVAERFDEEDMREFAKKGEAWLYLIRTEYD